MEMSRQRLRPSLQERWTQDVASLSTAVLRLIEEEASKKKSGEVRAVVSSDMSTFLLNERRARVNEIEERTDVRIIIVSDPTRSDNRFEVTRLRTDDKKNKDHASYDIQSEIGTNGNNGPNYKKTKFEKPAVSLTPPKKPKKKGEGIFKRFLKLFDSSAEESKKPQRKNQRNRKRPDNRNRKPQSRNAPRNNNKTKADKPTEKKKPVNKISKDNSEKKDENKTARNTNRRKPRNDKIDSTADKPKQTAKVAENQAKEKESPREINKPIKKPTAKKPSKIDTKDPSSQTPLTKQDKPSEENAKKPVKKPVKKTAEKKIEKASEENIEKVTSKDIDQVPTEVKKAKDWGRASNDPRNKS